MIPSIWSRSCRGTTTRSPKKFTPSAMWSSSLTFQYARASTGMLYIDLGQLSRLRRFTWHSIKLASDVSHISSILAALTVVFSTRLCTTRDISLSREVSGSHSIYRRQCNSEMHILARHLRNNQVVWLQR